MGIGAVPRLLVVAAALLALSVPAQASAATAPPPKLPARAAILAVLNTGQRLYGLNAQERLPIASTTKMMTALVTLRHASLNDVFTEPNYHFAAVDSQIYLVPGERMSVHDLMIAMLVPSADDAAKDLAYNVGGHSVARFIGMMNQDARQLGLTHTHYSTPIGLDTPGNYSSASDLVKLAGYLLERYPFFARAVALPEAFLKTGDHPRDVVSRNDLVARVSWIRGVKTGHTHKAGYVLVAEGRRGGMTLLSAVLGTPSEAARDASTLHLLDWGYSNFRLASPLTAGAVMARPTENGYPDRHASVVAAREFSWAVPRGARLRVEVSVPHDLSGPLRRHTRVGTATVLEGTRPVGRVGLVLDRAVPGLGTFAAAARFLTRPITLVVLIVILAAMAGLTVRGRGRRRARSRIA
jgi:serine-type D-Ala-D-Ala carboxypeptidase (penicillin-binding protein 5/6)